MADSLTRDEAHAFWLNPDADNDPAGYLDAAPRSDFLVELMRRYVKPDWRILELGSNSGRNLLALTAAGYRHVSGIEINPEAAALSPSLRVMVGPVEDVIGTFRSDSVDVVFTMAVLEHLHPDSVGVFAEMARITRCAIVTIEDEHGTSNRHWPRDYGRVFTAFGWRQIDTRSCADVEGLGPDFVARVFTT